MSDDRASLERLRRRIDEIDDQLHDLLMQRTLIVREVAAAKALGAGADETMPHGSQALAMRPDREAEVTRRLVGRHQGELPVLVIVRLWRELMTAKTRLQAPLKVLVYHGDNPFGYWDLARFYFGSPTPLEAMGSAPQILDAVSRQTNSIGILPAPNGDANDWWTALLTDGLKNVEIVASLPFVFGGDEAIALPRAFVVAPIEARRTGDDTTLFAVTLPGPVEDLETQVSALGGSLFAEASISDGHGVLIAFQNSQIDCADIEGAIDGAGLVKRIGRFANPIDLDTSSTDGDDV